MVETYLISFIFIKIFYLKVIILVRLNFHFLTIVENYYSQIIQKLFSIKV